MSRNGYEGGRAMLSDVDLLQRLPSLCFFVGSGVLGFLYCDTKSAEFFCFLFVVIMTAVVLGRYRKEGICPKCGERFEVVGSSLDRISCSKCLTEYWVYPHEIIERDVLRSYSFVRATAKSKKLTPHDVAKEMLDDDFFDGLFNPEEDWSGR